MNIKILDDSGEAILRQKRTRNPSFNIFIWNMIKEHPKLEKSAYWSGTEFVKLGVYQVSIKAGDNVLEGNIPVKKADK